MKTLLFIAGYIFVFISLLPFVRSDNWIFRIFEYPRFQKLVVNAIVLIAFLFFIDLDKPHDLIFTGILFSNLMYLIYKVFPYLRIARLQMKRIPPGNEENKISLLICNVFQENKNVSRLLKQIELCDPDIVLLVEVDAYWDARLRVLNEKFPYRKLKPLQNTYGISLYSKLELKDAQVKFLIDKEIPSVHTVVKLRSGESIKLFGLHPQPPVPSENPRSTERDAEILLVAKQVEYEKVPVIVAGDLNDVAWSYTTELFLKVSGLLDPRRGRGFFNTFHVKHPLMRWPLDHVFCSKHFALVELKRLDDVGSDHFPMFISLQLSKEKAAQHDQEKLEKTSRDEDIAQEKIRKAS